ncbi:TetR/AcrR family transcriptional regulator [Psychromicrobium sp. YIM B11713]|uniref:TetR/AcrR family transcriptional regulator n=1 Tax=Psychromicrobium sp. YIM B11713 TaxID=3145233 RepID=UPI00374F91F9
MGDSAKISVNSAVAEPSLRDRKKHATRSAIAEAALELTLSLGFHNFTIEQLCEQVGVSRRTFFNYYASKEDAVLGWDGGEFPETLRAEFIARGPKEIGEHFSASLLEDLLWLFEKASELQPSVHRRTEKFIEAVVSDKNLLTRSLQNLEFLERGLREMIAERERVSPEHHGVQMLTLIIVSLARRATEESLEQGNPVDLAQVMRRYLCIAQEIFHNSVLKNEGQE